MKIPANVLKYRYHMLRPLVVQPFFWVLFFLSPMLNWFRVDMLDSNFVFLGEMYPFEFEYVKWIPIVFYTLVLVIAVVSVIFGRLFCGWTCPHNTMTELTRGIRALAGREPEPMWMKRLFQKRPGLKPGFRIAAPFVALGFTTVMSLLLCSFIVPPEWIVSTYLMGTPHIALVFGNLLFVFIGMFLLYCGHDFCRACCPYGMAQSISAYQKGKWNPMEIQFKGDQETQCKTCTACRQVCPVDIDPRDALNLRVGQFDGCFNCGECIDACKTVQTYKEAPGLLSFRLPKYIKYEPKTGSDRYNKVPK